MLYVTVPVAVEVAPVMLAVSLTGVPAGTEIEVPDLPPPTRLVVIVGPFLLTSRRSVQGLVAVALRELGGESGWQYQVPAVVKVSAVELGAEWLVTVTVEGVRSTALAVQPESV